MSDDIRPMTQDERERAMERDKINSSQDACRERDALAEENERLQGVVLNEDTVWREKVDE